VRWKPNGEHCGEDPQITDGRSALEVRARKPAYSVGKMTLPRWPTVSGITAEFAWTEAEHPDEVGAIPSARAITTRIPGGALGVPVKGINPTSWPHATVTQRTECATRRLPSWSHAPVQQTRSARSSWPVGRGRGDLAHAGLFLFFSFLFSISFKFSNLYSKFQMYSNLNFNFLSAKISPNINFTVYNIIIIIDSFPYYLFMGETNDFIKIPFFQFLFYVFI
jgi:hypothetical protein